VWRFFIEGSDMKIWYALLLSFAVCTAWADELCRIKSGEQFIKAQHRLARVRLLDAEEGRRAKAYLQDEQIKPADGFAQAPAADAAPFRYVIRAANYYGTTNSYLGEIEDGHLLFRTGVLGPRGTVGEAFFLIESPVEIGSYRCGYAAAL
jgi:hypothetical protein